MQAPNPPQARRPGFWEGPLGYRQATLVVVTAFALGVFYQWRMPRVPSLSTSVAGALCGGFVLAMAFASLRWRKTRVMDWLAGVPFAVVSISGVMLVAAVGASVPAAVLKVRFGMESAYSSWPFAMVLLVMLSNLVAACARRVWPLTWRNVRFTLNHAGLAVALLGGLISAAGMQRLTLTLEQGRETAVGVDAGGHTVPLPFSVTLRRFDLDTFPPTLSLLQVDAEAPGGFVYTPGSAFVKAGASDRIGGYRVHVLQYLPRAANVGGVWREVPHPGAGPAARVAVRDSAGKMLAQGWVSSGGFGAEAEMLRVGDGIGIGMDAPRPRAYRSTVSVRRPAGEVTRDILVNKPLRVGDWRLYQVGYDERMGAMSEFSVLEAVRDRGLPVVYTGFFMMLAGAVALLWEGAREGGAE